MGLLLTLLALGVVAKTSPIAHGELAIDQQLAQGRTAGLTSLAAALTAAATPEIVGITAILVPPVALAVWGRRTDALRWVCVLGGALATALVAKVLIAEHRPPVALWAIPADSGASYPSGHTTVAAAIAVGLAILARTTIGRMIAGVGAVYALGVAASRVYVANHYPLDVVGSILAAAAAGLVVTGLTGIPLLAVRLDALETVRLCRR